MRFINKLATWSTALVLALSATAMVAAPAYAASAKDSVCEGITITEGTSNTSCSDSGKGLDGVIRLAVNLLSLIAGIAAVIMIIVGGIKYVTSQGESSNTAAAKNTIIYALVGLVIVALAQFIVRFTLSKATDASNGKTGSSVAK